MKRVITLAFFVLLVLYVLFQARFLILGPRINVEEPLKDAVVNAGALEVKGTATNVAYLTLDDRRIYTDTNGAFDEKLIVSPGINIIKLTAKDRFGRERDLLIRVLANQ